MISSVILVLLMLSFSTFIKIRLIPLTISTSSPSMGRDVSFMMILARYIIALPKDELDTI